MRASTSSTPRSGCVALAAQPWPAAGVSASCLGNPPLQQQYAFVGTGRATIQVIEPMHFRVVGEVSIRSNVTGALRAASCAPDAPTGCVATIYATTADGIVAVHVQQTHLAQ
jgi:hypothetical protein